MPSSDEIPIPRFTPSESFSTEELQKSIGQPPKPKLPTPELRMKKKASPPRMAKTKRAERIANVLQGKPSQNPPNVPEQELLDHEARAAFGRLVSVFIEKGYHKELEAILKEHVEFCENILGLLKKGS